uniref:Uncharacterized protein n=1 Tax=viral metagenome TaxID=1070528 RepID=A0A6C0EPY0_9ZZZZ
MFITTIRMLEPTTASVAVYLLSRTTTLKRNIIQKRPLHYKRKFCKWIVKNRHTIIEVGLDEISDILFETSNIIHIMPNPTILCLTYFIILIIFICL